MIHKQIVFFGEDVRLACDAHCEKAWGINGRPFHQLSPDPDDYEFLADHELPRAPRSSNYIEGGDNKPQSASERLNRWCARECERSVLVPAALPLDQIKLPDFSKRFKNIPDSPAEPEQKLPAV